MATTYYMPTSQQQSQINVQYVHSPPVTGFGVYNENDPQYLCCCGGHCHSRTGALIIGTLSLLEAGSTLSFFLYLVIQQGDTLLYLGLAWAIADLLIICMLIYGVLKEQRSFVIPFMVLQILNVILYAVMVLLALLALTGSFVLPVLEDSGSRHYNQHYPSNRIHSNYASASVLYIVVSLVICGLCIALHLWWFMVILKCYRYIRDKRETFVPYSALYGQAQAAAVHMY